MAHGIQPPYPLDRHTKGPGVTLQAFKAGASMQDPHVQQTGKTAGVRLLAPLSCGSHGCHVRGGASRGPWGSCRSHACRSPLAGGGGIKVVEAARFM